MESENEKADCIETRKEKRKKIIDELKDENSPQEMKMLLEQMNVTNFYGKNLFKGKYSLLYLQNFLPWQKSLGNIFKITYVVCGAKLKDGLNLESYALPGSPESPESCLEMIFDSLFISEESKSSKSKFNDLAKFLTLYPLSPFIGRLLLDIYNSTEVKNMPMIAMCYGKVPHSVVMLGTSQKDKIYHRLLVTSEGVYMKKRDLPIVSDYKSSHITGIPPTVPLELSVVSSYNFQDRPHCVDELDTKLKPCKNPSVTLECHWKTCSLILEALSAESVCNLKIKTILGDDETGACAKYKELKIIQAIYQGNGDKWPDTGNDEEVMKKLKQFLTDYKDAEKRRELTANAAKIAYVFDRAVTETRGNADFTDHLWLILKDSSTSQGLVDAMNFAFRGVWKLDFPPYINRKNTTTMAGYMRQRGEGRAHVVDNTTAVNYLLEIACEKMRRDYEMIITGLELVPSDMINFFLKVGSNTRESVIYLKKLHTTVELVVVFIKALNLPKLLVSDFVRNILTYYMTADDVDPEHVFNFSISTVRARNLVTSFSPSTWELSLVSNQNYYTKQTDYCFIKCKELPANIDIKRHRQSSDDVYSCMKSVLIRENRQLRK